MKRSKVRIENNRINWTCLAGECPRSCCGPFQALSPRLQSVLGIAADEIQLTPEDQVTLRKNVGAASMVQTEMGLFIPLNDDGSCTYFNDDRLCTIYPFRPSLCRAYPFSLDLTMGLCIDLDCPGVGEGYTDIEIIDEYIRALAVLFRHHIDLAVGLYEHVNDETGTMGSSKGD